MIRQNGAARGAGPSAADDRASSGEDPPSRRRSARSSVFEGFNLPVENALQDVVHGLAVLRAVLQRLGRALAWTWTLAGIRRRRRLIGLRSLQRRNRAFRWRQRAAAASGLRLRARLQPLL